MQVALHSRAPGLVLLTGGCMVSHTRLIFCNLSSEPGRLRLNGYHASIEDPTRSAAAADRTCEVQIWDNPWERRR